MSASIPELGVGAFVVDAKGARCVELRPAPPVRAASVLKPLLAWTAADRAPFVGDDAHWKRLAQQSVVVSDNPATAELWSRAGEEQLLESLNERVGMGWRIDSGREHPSLRILVAAGELAAAYAAFAAEDTTVARMIRGVDAGGVHRANGSPLPTEVVYRAEAAGRPDVFSVDVDTIACPHLPVCAPAIDGQLVFFSQYHLDGNWIHDHRAELWELIGASGAVPSVR